jgi:nucleotide-binding universal stress UspA family protein
MKPRRKLTLRPPHAWPLPAPEPTRVPAEIDQNYRAKRIVDNAQAELQARHPDLSIIGSPVADDVRNALLQAASESEMLVLGSRGLELVESYFLGDTSMPVVARAERPVVLVRAETLKHLTQVLRTWRENIPRAVPSPSSPMTSRHPRSPNRPREPAMPLLQDDVSVLMCNTGLYAPRSHVRRSARPTPRSCSSSVTAPTSSRNRSIDQSEQTPPLVQGTGLRRHTDTATTRREPSPLTRTPRVHVAREFSEGDGGEGALKE